MRALDELLLQKLPRLHAHLVAKECDISLFATDWCARIHHTYGSSTDESMGALIGKQG